MHCIYKLFILPQDLIIYIAHDAGGEISFFMYVYKKSARWRACCKKLICPADDDAWLSAWVRSASVYVRSYVKYKSPKMRKGDNFSRDSHAQISRLAFVQRDEMSNVSRVCVISARNEAALLRFSLMQNVSLFFLQRRHSGKLLAILEWRTCMHSLARMHARCCNYADFRLQSALETND
jgi:hypothetical protein